MQGKSLTVFKHNHWLSVVPVLPRISLSRYRADWSSERDSPIALPTARSRTPRGARGRGLHSPLAQLTGFLSLVGIRKQ